MQLDETFWDTLSHYYSGQVLFSIQDVGITVSHLVVALLSVLLSFLVSAILRSLLRKRVFQKLNLDSGLEYALLRFTHFIVLVLGFYIGLQTINIPLGAMVGIFAVVGVGIGFGLQNLTSNFTSGVILLIERPIKVGDRLELNDVWGDVVKIKLRTTLIATPDGISIIIPNSKLLDEYVINYSYGDPRIRLRVPVGIAYGSNVELAISLMEQAAKEHSSVQNSPPPKVWFKEFGDSSLNLELLCWIPNAEQKFDVISALNIRIDHLFRDNGVEIPFPQRDLHLKSSKISLPAPASSE